MNSTVKRRILIFSTAYYPFVGGAEIAIKEITDRLSSELEFDLITAKLSRDLPNFERVGNVNVYRVGSGNKRFDKLFLPIRGVFVLHKLNNKNDYFCIWSMMVTFASLSGYIFNFFQILTNRTRLPVVLSLQEGDSDAHLKYRWGGLIWLSWKISLKNTNILTGLSNFLLQKAKEMGFNGQSFLVPNGVDLEVFCREIDPVEKDEIRTKLDKKEGDFFIVTSSRLTYKNAVDDIISSLKYLPDNVKLIVIGVGEDYEKLINQVNYLNLKSRVRFTGFIDHSKMPEYLSVCDIFIRPSRSEGFGNSFIEAMAAKIPVIATPVGGIVDFLDDNETGIFCAPNNPQSIARSVKLLMENKELVSKIVNNSHKMVIQRYSWDSIAQKMKSVFDKVS